MNQRDQVIGCVTLSVASTRDSGMVCALGTSLPPPKAAQVIGLPEHSLPRASTKVAAASPQRIEPMVVNGGWALMPSVAIDHCSMQVPLRSPVLLVARGLASETSHDASFRRSARVGSSIWKVEPLPEVDSTQLRPPCISTICLAMASPRPVPPLAFVRELSTWWN